MVRSSSSNSCFSFITCGSDRDAEDALHHSKSKVTTDKQWWSFRKRSERHGELSNTMIKETLPAGQIDNLDFASINFPSQSKPKVPYPLSTEVNALNFSKPFSIPILKCAEKIDNPLEESIVIRIQATIRAYLAQITLLRLKNLVKLQAAVRGHLVRRQAIESLRCVQAITKMQALMRARYAQMSLEVSGIREEFAGRIQRHNQSGKTSGREIPARKTNSNHSYTLKLLNNGFSHQLLELAPKRTPIYMKCDLSKPDSAWKWLVRWSSIPPSDFVQPRKPQNNSQNEEQIEKTDTATSDPATVQAERMPDSTDMRSRIREYEDEASLNEYDADDYEFEFCQPKISFSVSLNDVQKYSKVDSNQRVKRDSYKTSFNSIPSMNKDKRQQPIFSVGKTASEESNTQYKKSVFLSRVSREVCNSAFLAAPSKFEELSSTATPGGSIGLMRLDVGQELKLNSLSSSADSLMRSKEHSPKENLIFHDPIIELGSSECGTELSISSTLDSPDIPEVAVVYFGNESNRAEIINGNDSIGDAFNHENLDVEMKKDSSPSEPKLCCGYAEAGKLEMANGEAVNSVVDHPAERDAQIEIDAIIDQDAHRLSTEGTPRSHITAPELHTTPSSKTSVKANREQLNKSETTQNSKRQPTRKRLLSKPNHDSGGRKSTDQAKKDQNNGNRRISFSSEKPVHADQKARDRINSNCLPSYMQTTESAKVKALANNSSRSSPDVQANNVNSKKLHLLPGTNGKQGSPCKQSSIPQSEQVAKGHHGHSPREKLQR